MRSLVLFLAALLLPLTWACDNGTPEAATGRVEQTIPVAAVALAPTDLSLTLELPGSIEPIREVRVAARMSGILRAVAVEEGTRVASGSVLARFDISEEEAQLARARTILRNAEATYARARELRGRQLISAVDYEQALADRQVARSEVELWETRTALGTVRAATAGVVTQKFVEAGNAVSSGEPLFVIADVSTLVVRVGVTDTHAGTLTEKQPVRITVDAMPGRTWTGSIRRIFPAADPETRLHPIEFELTPRPGEPRPVPGYLARVQVDADSRRGVLAVPNEALLASKGGVPSVLAIENDRLVRREIVPGVSRRDWTEVVEGLSPGDLVVASNPSSLREGARVRVTENVTPPEGSS